jgi:hypothetical protein
VPSPFPFGEGIATGLMCGGGGILGGVGKKSGTGGFTAPAADTGSFGDGSAHVAAASGAHPGVASIGGWVDSCG